MGLTQSPYKQGLEQLSKHLNAFCTTAKVLRGYDSSKRQRLQDLAVEAHQLVAATRAATSASDNGPERVASAIIDTKFVNALAAAAVATLQLQQPEFTSLAYSMLDGITCVLAVISQGLADSVKSRQQHADDGPTDWRALGTAAAVQLTQAGLMALLPHLAKQLVHQLGVVQAGSDCSGSSSSGASSSNTMHIEGPAGACDPAEVQSQTTVLLHLLCGCCIIWPQGSGRSSAARATTADVAAFLALGVMQYVDRTLQQLAAGENPSAHLAALASAAMFEVCHSLYVVPFLFGEGKQVKDYVMPGRVVGGGHRAHLLTGLCCGHLALLLPPCDGSSGSSGGSNTSRCDNGSSGGCCQSSSAATLPSRPAQLQLPKAAAHRVTSVSPVAVMDGAAAWKLVPQYQGLFGRLLPEDQQSLELLEKATLSPNTLMWCSMLLNNKSDMSLGARQQHALGLDAGMAAMLASFNQLDWTQLSAKELSRHARQAYIAAAVSLRWLAGLQRQDLIADEEALLSAMPAAECSLHALRVIGSSIATLHNVTGSQSTEDASEFLWALVHLPQFPELQQLLPLVLLSTQQAIQRCQGQQCDVHGTADSGSSSGSSSSGGNSLDQGSHENKQHLQDLSACLLSAVVNAHTCLFAAASIMCTLDAAVASEAVWQSTATVEAAEAKSAAAWQPYAAHFTALLEAYVRSDAMGAGYTPEMMHVVLLLAAPYAKPGEHNGGPVVLAGPLLAHAVKTSDVAPGSAAQMQLYSLLCSSLKLAAADTDMENKAACVSVVSATATYMQRQLMAEVGTGANVAQQAASADGTGVTASSQVPAGAGSMPLSQAASATAAPPPAVAVEALLPWLRLQGCCLLQFAAVLQGWHGLHAPEEQVACSSSCGRCRCCNSGNCGNSRGKLRRALVITNFCQATTSWLDLLQQAVLAGQKPQSERQQGQGQQQQVGPRATGKGKRRQSLKVGRNHAGNPDDPAGSTKDDNSTKARAAAASRCGLLSARGYDVSKVVQQVVEAWKVLLAFLSAAECDGVGVTATQQQQQQQLSVALNVSKISAAADSLASIAIPQVCNNPHCSNMDHHSELMLVSGSSCICGGCRTAAYCGPACQKQHWPQHKTVCRALAQAKTGLE